MPMTDQPPPRDELLGGSSVGELASITTSEHNGGLVVTISGELDISNIERVAAVIHALPNTEDGLLVDLSAVSYLDSSAVSLVHDLAMRLRNRAQRMIVVSAPGTPPRRILDLTALDVNATVADALEPGLSLLGGNEPR
jgi:anti-anti-sigma factor